MIKTQIHAEIVGHSLSPQGDELISVLCTFPRIILAEVNTHRMLSKNTSSSRAIPFNKMVEAVQENPFIPIAWQRDHKGMQGSEYLVDEKDIEYAIGTWLHQKDRAIEDAKILNSGANVTKQLCNRLLEPFMWTTMLITGSKEGWQNFFKLRCPDYEVFTLSGLYNVKSCKEARELALYPDEFKTFEIALQHNKGQAEIHIMDLAEKIYDCIQESVPKQLKAGEWHVPFIDRFESYSDKEDGSDFDLNDIKISVALAARTSYTVVEDEKELDYSKMIELHDRLIEMRHDSPMEHCARAMSDDEYYSYVKGTVDAKIDADGFINIEGHTNLNVFGWCNNLKGFIPYRYFIDNKNM